MSEVIAAAEAARRRAWDDRPSPALPLALLGCVVLGGIALTFLDPDSYPFYFDNGLRLGYWLVATLVAYLVTVLIARRQGYRSGVWVDRRALVVAGSVALAVIVLAVLLGPFLPGDLLIRGDLPLLALTVGIGFWAHHERRPGLWVVAGLLVPLTVLANLYNMENLLFRLGVPLFDYADQVVNLGVVAIVLLGSAAVFAVRRRARRSRAGR